MISVIERRVGFKTLFNRRFGVADFSKGTQYSKFPECQMENAFSFHLIHP
jgi:hypothetical protein